MSQGIMEKNLPVAESIGEGDKVRIVTSAGNSKNVDMSLIVDADFTVNVTSSTQTADKTAQEIYDAYNAGKKINLIVDGTVQEVVWVNVISGPGGFVSLNLQTLKPLIVGGALNQLKAYNYSFSSSGLTINEYIANFAS